MYDNCTLIHQTRCREQENKIMWITVLLVCLTFISSSSAQVTNNDVHTVTEIARTNQDVEWDTTRPSVAVSIKDGRSDTANTPREEISSHPLLYSNQWQPFLMPIGFNNHRDVNNRPPADIEDNTSYQFLPTFLRRPDSDLNLTSSSRYTQLPNGFRYPFAPLPMPMAPFNPMFFHPHQPHLFPSGGYGETDVSSVLQNATASATGPAVSITDASNLKDVQESIVPPSPFAAIPHAFERYHPINIYRNRDDVLSLTPPAFVPSLPVVPNTNGNSLHPVVFPFTNSHLFDREGGSGALESVSTGLDVPESEASVTSRDDHEQETRVANGTPSNPSPTFVPPEPLPLPIAGFPFGVLPPPIFPPIYPGLGAPFSPLAEPINIPRESPISDAALTHPGIPAIFPPLVPAPGNLPPVNTLESKSELSVPIETIAEGTLPNETPGEAKIPYEFGFDMNDGQGTDQYRKEVSDVSGAVRGSYGYRDMFGVYRFVNYIADKNGFRAFIKSNEPGVASSGSADVVVLAEHPPVQTIAESAKASEPEAVIVPDTTTDLVVEGSRAEAK